MSKLAMRSGGQVSFRSSLRSTVERRLEEWADLTDFCTKAVAFIYILSYGHP